MSPPRALLVDLDGVIRFFPPLEPIERETGLTPGALAEAAFAPERLTPALKGLSSDEQWRADIARVLSVNHPASAAHEAVRRWSESSGNVDPLLVSLLRR